MSFWVPPLFTPLSQIGGLLRPCPAGALLRMNAGSLWSLLLSSLSCPASPIGGTSLTLLGVRPLLRFNLRFLLLCAHSVHPEGDFVENNLFRTKRELPASQ